MFQDYEGIPKGMISESHISEDLWQWLELDEEERELLAVPLRRLLSKFGRQHKQSLKPATLRRARVGAP
jgi:hypothetical protein